MSWKEGQNTPEYTLKRKCLHTVLLGGFSFVCVLGGIYLYLLVYELSWFWASLHVGLHH